MSNMNIIKSPTTTNSLDRSGVTGHAEAVTSSTLTLTEQVKRHVNSGVFAPGDRYLTIRELARRFCVSPVTVQRTVRDLVNEGVLYVRGNAGTFVGTTAREAPAALQIVRIIAP